MRVSKKIKYYQPASDGWHVATCADVEDRGIQSTQWGDRQQVRLVFLLDEKAKDGQPIRVATTLNASAHKDAKLTKFIRILAPETLDTPDPDAELEPLIGRSIRLKTQQTTPKSDGRIFTDIVGMESMKLRDKVPAIPLNFVRAGDRPAKTQTNLPGKTNGSIRRVVKNQVDDDVAFPAMNDDVA